MTQRFEAAEGPGAGVNPTGERPHPEAGHPLEHRRRLGVHAGTGRRRQKWYSARTKRDAERLLVEVLAEGCYTAMYSAKA